MSCIRATNTRPELQVRKALHALGFRYRLHERSVPGKPDLVLPRFRAAIFINGCFWHGHDCPLFRMPGTRQDFWKAKISRNIERDRQVREQLAEAGWRHLTIWECALRGRNRLGLEETVSRVSDWLKTVDQRAGEIRASHQEAA